MTLACLFAALPVAFIGNAAQAQQYAQQNQPYAQRNSSPHIDGFNVDEVRKLGPGTELNFTIYGSPGGTAALRIDGAQRSLPLVETEPGQYSGTYVIGSRDRIVARSQVTGNLRLGNQVATAVLSESLQVGVGAHASRPGTAGNVEISRFEMQPVGDLEGGSELPFTLYGTPGGKADLTIAGVRGHFFLDEVRPGEYSGVYTVRRADRITPSSAVVATLHVGQQVTSTTLRQPLLASRAPAPIKRSVVNCISCGTVEAVNLIQVKGDAGYLGTIGGGLAGALVGSQIGGGNGRTAAEIAAAVGGAYAGREVERNVRKTAHYEVVVRLDNGGTQTVSQDAEPGYRVGDKVRIADGQLTRQ